MYQIPDKNRITQVNDGDVLGTMWSSFNLNLQDNKGRIKVSPRGMTVARSDDPNTSNLTTPVCFQFYDGKIWTIAGKMFKNTGTPGSSWTEDSTSASPSVSSKSDMELFDGNLYVVGTSEVRYYDGSSWTEIGSNVGSTDTTCCVFNGRLYYSTLSSQVWSIDSAGAVSQPSGSPNSVQYALQLADNGAGGSSVNKITSIRASSNRVWIATSDTTSNTNSSGRKAAIFEWDGSATTAYKRYEIDSVGVLALVIKDDVPYAVDADGRLLGYNGGGFAEIARLPVPNEGYLKNPLASDPTLRFIHPRGITVKDGKIVMLINNEAIGTGAPIYENIPSGIWEYDEDIGLYHRESASQWIFDETTTRTDFAQNRVRAVGALFNTKTVSNSGISEGNLMYGVRYYLNTSDSRYAIMLGGNQDNQINVGYFVTTKLESEQIEEEWQKIYAIHKELLDSADRICIKYRTSEVEPTEANITWTSTTQFTSTDDLSDYAVGDEVEITLGTGGGQIEKITAISVSSGTYTVTLANAVTGANGTAKARFQHWIDVGEEQTSQSLQHKQFAIGENANWIQIKCVMYFTPKDELNSLKIINANKPHIPSA